MYTLYYSPGSASMAVHLALLEMGLPYQLALVDFERRAQRAPAYLALNPAGMVPTLVADGVPLVESGAVLLNLAERHPDPALAPLAGEAGRARWIETIVLLANQLGGAYRLWFYPGDLGMLEHTPESSLAIRARIEALWDRLEARLQADGPYLLGARFSSADLLLVMYLRWSRNMPRPALEWPALARLAALVKARPSWHQLVELESLQGW
ncbi:MAG: glutathione S-transferase family protein [Pseudomonadota bacterium]